MSQNVKCGDIILLHDIYDSSVAAALEIVDELKAKGFIFVPWINYCLINCTKACTLGLNLRGRLKEDKKMRE